MKIHQLIAILQSVKNKSSKAKTAVYQLAQKVELFKGLSRTYEPRQEDGYIYPPESKPVQKQATDLMQQFRTACTELFDLCATQEKSNTKAKASVTVDGQVIVADVPVGTLLFLEKQLVDVQTFIGKLPVLDIDQEWEYDSNRGCYATAPKQTAKTKKITKPVVLYEATKEHPAQVKEVSEDIVEGTWSLINFSGALPQDQINEMLRRVDKLLKAVVIAREEANSIEVEELKVAEPIFDYIFDA
ncbi:MAG: hypothetical protein F6J87_16275 [Spirulina sp. SIO3F2]|nr:hypothetical protein [Spirulina sp. SIO3F2]